ncbi:unnamed protein product [Schistosoma rodhaini]|uniref:Uncharacterized protein n=1 Tax=Schistosoma rodhaini TaxID=6188 RepID=A0AA85GD75_9TREM|nr:unnamed protein product [Schistosoma rodhaini]
MNIGLMSTVLSISKTLVASKKCLGIPFKAFPLSMPCRLFAHGIPLTKTMIEDRVMLVLRLYDKIDPYKVGLIQ